MKLVTLACFLGMGLLSQASAGEFSDELRKARLGDYGAQRNVAFMLKQGDGTSRNVMEGCAWRFVVMLTQGALVGDTDVLIEDRCGGVARLASSRADVILREIGSPPRSIDRDVAGLTSEDCPGPRCPPQDVRFVADYRAAVKGDVDSMRRVRDCFAKTCGVSNVPFNLVQACIWSTRVVASNGAVRVAADDRARTSACNVQTPGARAVIEHHMAELDGIAARGDGKVQ